MLHFLVVGILVIVVAILAYFGVNVLWAMPVEASTQAVSDRLALEYPIDRHVISVCPHHGTDGIQSDRIPPA